MNPTIGVPRLRDETSERPNHEINPMSSKHKHKKNKHKKNKGQTSDRHPASDADRTKEILVEIESHLTTLSQLDESTHPGPIWGAIHKLLLKTSAEPGQIARTITQRNTDALRQIIHTLREKPQSGNTDGDNHHDASPNPDNANDKHNATDETPSHAQPVPDIPPEVLKKALRAFRKRLKLTRLDHESKLGVGPMSTGRKADFDAIMAPYEFPAEVWEQLAAQGQLEKMGAGFYKLADQ